MEHNVRWKYSNVNPVSVLVSVEIDDQVFELKPMTADEWQILVTTLKCPYNSSIKFGIEEEKL